MNYNHNNHHGHNDHNNINDGKSSSSRSLQRSWLPFGLLSMAALVTTISSVYVWRRRKRLHDAVAAATAAANQARDDAIAAAIEKKKHDRRNGILEKNAGIIIGLNIMLSLSLSLIIYYHSRMMKKSIKVTSFICFIYIIYLSYDYHIRSYFKFDMI